MSVCLVALQQDQVRSFALFLTDLHQHITDDIPRERRESPCARPNFDVRPVPSSALLRSQLSIEGLVAAMMPRPEDIPPRASRPEERGLELPATAECERYDRVSAATAREELRRSRGLDPDDPLPLFLCFELGSLA